MTGEPLAHLENIFTRFARDESGATAIEYSMIASAVFLGILVPVGSIKDSMNSTYNQIHDYFVTVGL
jgi:pilus assembly protein Flp/PilA